MGFSLARSQNFQSTVTVNVKQENGAWKLETFQAIFERVEEQDREDRLLDKHTDLVRRQLVGWKMKDNDGQDVPFTPENLDAFLKLTGAVRETVIQFWKDNIGAKEKN